MASTNLMSLSDIEKKKFLDSFDCFISDCDGVLWHGRKPVPGAQDVLKKLVSIGKRRFYFTNNSTMTRKQFVEKFNALGFDAEEDEILSTAWLTAKYLKNINFNKKVYAAAGFAVKEELDALGIENIGVGPDNYEPKSSSSSPLISNELELAPDIGAVVVGYDFYFSYPKIMKACCYLHNPDCLFIATNKDEKFPLSEGVTVPGAGAFVAALETCSERNAEVMGKPSPFAIDNVLIPSGLEPKRCLMIGDRCNTDIHFGKQRGMVTLLVETGVHKYSDLEKYKSSGMDHLIPSYYTSSVADLLEIMSL
ncbi:chronophin isoform X2 [Halyomorpha halys]|nr:pyridoxal phosphate phosphatase-like isoform X2 [Halyomorpha halys]XP_014290901.1 pyridoxal phosphate phosphatase-like isoform X2 [Halyomorpha halys]